MKVYKVILAAAMMLFLAGAVFAGGSKEAMGPPKGPVTVGSKIDTEGGLLGQMIVLLLEADGFEVVDKVQFGTTPVVRKAIISGELDIYPEYTGNGGFFFDKSQWQDPTIWKDAKKGWETVAKLDLETNNLVWLQAAPANNTWAVAIRQDLADAEKIKTWEDFADYVNGGGKIKLAGSEEFIAREDALPSFETAYGFKLEKDQLLALSGGNTATTEKAAAEMTDGVNAAMAYGTDGQLAALGLWVLEDTKGVQPVYEPAPIIRAETNEKYPEIAKILKPVFKKLDLVTLQTLNSKIAVEGMNSVDVARDWLMAEGYLK